MKPNYYYLRQTRAANGTPVRKFVTEKYTLTEDWMNCGLYLTLAMVRNHILPKVLYRFGGDWEIVRRDAADRDLVVHTERRCPKSTSEIERDIRSGHAVSAADLNRFARSPRGAMFISALRRGTGGVQ